MNQKNLGTLGIIIFGAFLFGFGVFHFILNPEFYTQFDAISLTTYNVEQVKGVYWVRYFNYVTIGLSIVGFCVGLWELSKNSATNKVAIFMLGLSGLTWLSFGLFGLEDRSDFDIGFVMARMVICLALGAFGFMLLSAEIVKITHSSKVQWPLFSLGVLIGINGAFSIFYPFDYPNALGYLSWVFYFFGFGIIGFGLLRSRPPLEK